MASGISRVQFLEEILGIESFSCKNDSFSWTYKSVSGSPDDTYLECKMTSVCESRRDCAMGEAGISNAMLVADEEDSYTLDVPQTEVCTFEYHIVYSTSYEAPVLYFNAYKQDGKLFTLEEIWARVPSYYRDRLEKDKWTFITQQEHPLLGRPFFQIHPCHTSTLMRQLPDEKRNYVVSWLSVFGPVVGLNLPLCYAEMG